MKTFWHFFSFILIFQLTAFSASGQYSIWEVGLSPKEGTIWSENCQVPAVLHLGDTLTIQGDFDGIRSNTRLIIAGQLVNPSYETRLEAQFLLPPIAQGQRAFSLTDGWLNFEGNIQLIGRNAQISYSSLEKPGEIALESAEQKK
jgi:hypothetical protein